MGSLCPDTETLMDFTEGRLTDRQRHHIEAHLADCDLCREQVSVCADLLQGELSRQVFEVPAAITERAVMRVTQMQSDSKQTSVVARIRQWIIKGDVYQ